jgi:hypothetical protein
MKWFIFSVYNDIYIIDDIFETVFQKRPLIYFVHSASLSRSHTVCVVLPVFPTLKSI